MYLKQTEMTPQEEKAKELVELFNGFPFATVSVNKNKEYAKQCALKCVEESLQHLYNVNQSNTYWIQDEINELLEVKQEIEKL